MSLQRFTTGVCHALLRFPSQAALVVLWFPSQAPLVVLRFPPQPPLALGGSQVKYLASPHSSEQDTLLIVFLISKQAVI
jgi:hypothetical protein